MAVELKDARIEQIEKKIDTEREAERAKYAFTGFGRSTDLAGAIQKVEEHGIAFVKVQLSIISMEASLQHYYKMASMYDVDNSGLIGALRNGIAIAGRQKQKLEQAQSQRMLGISTSIINFVRGINQKGSAESQYAPKNRKPKELKIKSSVYKAPTKMTSITNLSSLKPYSAIINAGKLTKLSSFSTLKSL